MNIALKPEQEQFIQSQIDQGRFKSADEAVSQAFKLLENQEREYQSWIEDTRQKVEVGVAELDSAEPTRPERRSWFTNILESIET